MIKRRRHKHGDNKVHTITTIQRKSNIQNTFKHQVHILQKGGNFTVNMMKKSKMRRKVTTIRSPAKLIRTIEKLETLKTLDA